MATIDLSPLTDLAQDQATESLHLLVNLKSLLTQYLDRAAVLFSPTGTADGNDVVSMWSGCLRSDRLISDVLASQTDSQLQASWEVNVGVPVPTIRTDLSDLSDALRSALTLIENNVDIFLEPTLNRSAISMSYPLLTASQRSVANTRFTAISSLLVT